MAEAIEIAFAEAAVAGRGARNRSKPGSATWAELGWLCRVCASAEDDPNGYAAAGGRPRSLQSPFLLLVRLYWGWQFAQTGWGKLHNLDKVTDFFTSLGIPAPGVNAVFIVALEFVGGILLALGLGSRLIALLLACDMLVAYHRRRSRSAVLGLLRSGQVLRRRTLHLPVRVADRADLRPGRFALDAILARRFQKTSPVSQDSAAARQ